MAQANTAVAAADASGKQAKETAGKIPPFSISVR
jgi:hypothetical protein